MRDTELAEKAEIGGLRLVLLAIAKFGMTISLQANAHAPHLARQPAHSELRKPLRL